MMDKRIIIFGQSGRFGTCGQLSNYPSSVFKTCGLNGIIQPCKIFIADEQQDGPYETRTKLTTDDQAPTVSAKTLHSTEFIKGNGLPEVDKANDCSGEKVSIVNEPLPADNNVLEGLAKVEAITKSPMKISKVEFKRKVDKFEANQVAKKKKTTHKFNLY